MTIINIIIIIITFFLIIIISVCKGVIGKFGLNIHCHLKGTKLAQINPNTACMGMDDFDDDYEHDEHDEDVR